MSDEVKRCGRCTILKPLTEYGTRARGDGRQGWCRDCFRTRKYWFLDRERLKSDAFLRQHAHRFTVLTDDQKRRWLTPQQAWVIADELALRFLKVRHGAPARHLRAVG
jgi:hypothetical protein